MRWFAATLAVLLAVPWATTALAAQEPAEGNVLSCRIEGQDRMVSVTIAGTRATYRYGPSAQAPELTLSSALDDLDYRRKNGPGDTIDEIATFTKGDTAYSVEAGFRDGAAPDPTALHPFAQVAVSRGARVLARLPCRPDSIRRVHDRLLAAMRAIGRERASDGQSFPNYAIQYPAPAAQSPPCKADFNVDTCWSRGVAAARGGDLRGALAHFDMSCAFGSNALGCYEAGKLYLQNRQLRDYARAQARFAPVCDGDDPGHGPYACKYLGWMHLTGTGTPRDLDKAWSLLARACFLHNDADMIDPEGCHHFARTVAQVRAQAPREYAQAEFVSYVALSQACTDNARTVCEEAQALHREGSARGAAWVRSCDAVIRTRGTFASCAELSRFREDYEDAKNTRYKLKSLFLAALDRLD